MNAHRFIILFLPFTHRHITKLWLKNFINLLKINYAKDTIFDATSFTHNCAKSGLPNLFHSKNTQLSHTHSEQAQLS